MVGVNWQRVRLPGGVSIAIPSELSSGDAQGVDSSVQSWLGDGIEVLVDFGPMSDRLDRYEGSEEEFSGRRARVVCFNDEGTHVRAAHIDDPALTVIVRTERSEDQGVAHTILKSLTIRE